RRRRGHQIRGPVADADAVRQVELPAAAEGGARLAGVGIDREEPRVDRPGEYAPRARAGPARVAARPDTHAARGVLGIAARAVDVWIEAPLLAPGDRTEGDHDVGAGLEVQPAECQHRRRLEGQAPCLGVAGAELSGAVGPGDRELADVGAVDL